MPSFTSFFTGSVGRPGPVPAGHGDALKFTLEDLLARLCDGELDIGRCGGR